MSILEQTIQEIPIRHDIFSYIIFLGAVNGLFLSFLIFWKRQNNRQTNTFIALLLLFISLVLFGLFLGYTGLMKYVLHLNDSTEALVISLPTIIYLIIVSVIARKQFSTKELLLYFALPIVYFLWQWVYFLQPLPVKLNAHIGAFHYKVIDFVPHDYSPLLKFYLNSDLIRWLVLGSCLIYTILGSQFLLRSQQKQGIRFFKRDQKSKFGFALGLIILTLTFVGSLVVVYVSYETDLGDHYLAALLCFGILLLGFFISGESRFFETAWIADKYETSGLKSDRSAIVRQIKEHFEQDPFYLDSDCTLKNLAGRLNLPANYLSQSINSELDQNFNEFINRYRIMEAQRRLMSPAFKHLNIEGIGNSVGFKSKSAFYAAFKKLTNTTPSQFIQANSHN